VALGQNAAWCPSADATALAAIPEVGSSIKEIKVNRNDDDGNSYASPRMLRTAPVNNQCQHAWDNECYNKTEDWRSCCTNCSHLGHATQQCNWDYSAAGGARIQGSFIYHPITQRPCNAVCARLGGDNNNEDFCPGGSIYTLANDCPPAQHSLDEATEHCHVFSQPQTLLPATAVSVPQVTPQQVPLLSACAGVATFAAFAAAFFRLRRSDDPHGHS